jgi:hypothetical protein
VNSLTGFDVLVFCLSIGLQAAAFAWAALTLEERRTKNRNIQRRTSKGGA